MKFSPDGRYIVSGSDDTRIIVWDSVNGEAMLGPPKGHTKWVQSANFSPDGKRIVSGSNDKTIIVWDVRIAKLRLVLLKDTLGQSYP